MKLTTAEIKIFIRNCVGHGESKTVAEIEAYIKQSSDKQFTKGQLAGAIAQLVDRNELMRVERGIYRKAEEIEDSNGVSAQNDVNFRMQINACLKRTAVDLARIVSSVDILAADEEDFELLNRIRTLRGDMESIINEEA